MNRLVNFMHVSDATIDQVYERIVGTGHNVSTKQKRQKLNELKERYPGVLHKNDAAFKAAVDPKTVTVLVMDVVYGHGKFAFYQSIRLIDEIEVDCVRQQVYHNKGNAKSFSTFLDIYPSQGEAPALTTVPFFLKRGERGSYVFMITSLSEKSVPAVPFDFECNKSHFVLRQITKNIGDRSQEMPWMQMKKYTERNLVFKGSEEVDETIVVSDYKTEVISENTLSRSISTAAPAGYPKEGYHCRTTSTQKGHDEEEYEREDEDKTQGYDDTHEDDDTNAIKLMPPQRCKLVFYDGPTDIVINDAKLVEIQTDSAAESLTIFVLVSKNDYRAHGEKMTSKNFRLANAIVDRVDSNYLPLFFVGYHAYSSFEKSFVNIFIEGLKVDMDKKRRGLSVSPYELDIKGNFRLIVEY